MFSIYRKLTNFNTLRPGLLIGFNCISAQKEKILQRGYLRENTDKLLHMYTFIVIFSFFNHLTLCSYIEF